MTDQQDTGAPVAKKRYVPRAEARVILLDATIELLHEVPFNEVTIRRIAEHADLNAMAIMNIFGSQHGLFIAVTRVLSARFANWLANVPDESLEGATLFHEDIVLRTRLLAWLLGQGVDPESLRVDPSLEVSGFLLARQTRAGVDEHTAWLFTQILLYLSEGFITFQDTHDRRPDDLAEALALLDRVRDELPRLSADSTKAAP